jgi:ABC-2 type transport system ATP-binding protein
LEENVIECERVTHYYGSRLIHEELSFEVKRGKILGLLGKNGTGKTTIINILNGYLTPRKGACRLFGEDSARLSPATKARVGLLLEGHVQHAYFNVDQIERFYSSFYPRWRSDAYRTLLEKLQVSRAQKINTMSRGQRSQVALGLLFAQDPELLVLDDFSMGLDPGYRRLFAEYLKEYAADGNKTIFLTSHIIQDMEMLIDDCIILDYGRVLLHRPAAEILETFRRYRFAGPAAPEGPDFHNSARVGDRWETYSFLPPAEVARRLRDVNARDMQQERLSLEDAFIGLTGKY